MEAYEYNEHKVFLHVSTFELRLFLTVEETVGLKMIMLSPIHKDRICFLKIKLMYI